MKTLTIIFATLACILSSSSCCNISSYTLDDDYDTTQFVVRTIDLANFNAIDCGGVANITYEQSNTYSIVARSIPNVLDKTQITVKDHKLIIDQSGIHMKKMPPIFIVISMPQINSIGIGGVATFKAKEITTDGKINIDISGVGNVEIDSISCAEVQLDLSGTSKIYAKINATNSADIDISGAAKGNVSIKSEKLKIDSGGAVKMDFSFSGGKADVDCSGVSKINLNVNCRELKAENSGVSKLTISGIAENSNISSSGVSSIDTKGLNNF